MYHPESYGVPRWELPFGAHPTSIYREYDYDAEEFKRCVEASKKPDLWKVYPDKYVYGAKDHEEYLELVGGMRREDRRFRRTISFVVSPGLVNGGNSRKKTGWDGGPSRVITDKAIYGFHPETKKMIIHSIHPGNTLKDVTSTLGFQPIIPLQVPYTEPPTSEQLRLICNEINPERMYVG